MTTVEPANSTSRADMAQGSRNSQAPAPRLAYLLSQYPARSHTFFLNEILGLRARGLHIEVASINSPDRALNDLPPQEAAEARSTFYIKRANRIAGLLSLCWTALTRPGVVTRGYRAIASLPRLTSRERAFWLFYLAEAILLGRWMRRRKLTHLHVHFGGAVASVGMLASIAWQIPYSITIHGPEELLDPNGYQLPAKLTQAARVLCISDFCRKELCRVTPLNQWSKFAVLRLGVDPSLLAPRPAVPREPQTPLRLVCVGRLVADKGHRILLEALSLLRTQGLALQAILIGAGPLQTELQRYTAEQDLAELVTFTSGLSHTDTLAHVRTADLFALASFHEGVPVALMEAMSLGIPCVSTTVAGIPELIHSGEEGLLVPPGDPSAFADALSALIADAPLRQRLGKAGREKVLRDFNLPRNLDCLAAHFRECLSPARLPARTPQPRTLERQA